MAAQPVRKNVVDRSRLRHRLWLSVFLLIVGMLAIAFALIPQPWRDVISAALGAALAWLASLGVLVVALALGISLLLAATLVLWAPRRARPPAAVSGSPESINLGLARQGQQASSFSAVAQVNGIAPVSVYLDIENGQVLPPDVRALMQLIRERSKGRPIDLLLYGSAEQTAKMESYKQLWRHGFRSVDIPYKQLGKGTATNISDLGLALHAFERALFGPPDQTIIIISQDQGFLPLVYRLQGLRHNVELWARDVLDSYKDAAKYLDGVTWTNLAFPSAPAKHTQAARHAHHAPTAAARAASRSPVVALPSAPIEISMVGPAMERTRESITALQGKPNARKRLRAVLGDVREHILDLIGYARFSKASSRVECWLEHLGALGVLVDVAPDQLPTLGFTMPEAASALYELWLREVANAAEHIADATNRALKLSDVCIHMLATVSSSADLVHAPLRALLAQTDSRGEQHMRYFCQCARALGMLDFTDTENPYIIRVVSRAESGAQPDLSSQAPPDNPTAPVG